MYKHYIIFKSALLDIRNEWSWYLILMITNPLAILFFLRVVLGANISFLSYIVGSVIMTFGTGVFLSLGQTFAFYKATSSLDYYMALPLSKNEIILSLVFRNIILSLPSLLIIIVVGSIIYNAPIHLGLPFFVVIILTSLSLAGIGTIIGVGTKDMQVASILTQILNPLFVYLAPVFVVQSALPAVVSYLSYLFPTTYAANALRSALIENAFSIDTLILAVISFASLFIVSKLIDWRND